MVCALVSAVIEITQSILGIGANDIADIVANTVGGFFGAGLAVAVSVILETVRRRRLDPVRLAKFLGATVATAATLAGLSIGGA